MNQEQYPLIKNQDRSDKSEKMTILDAIGAKIPEILEQGGGGELIRQLNKFNKQIELYRQQILESTTQMQKDLIQAYSNAKTTEEQIEIIKQLSEQAKKEAGVIKMNSLNLLLQEIQDPHGNEEAQEIILEELQTFKEENPCPELESQTNRKIDAAIISAGSYSNSDTIKQTSLKLMQEKADALFAVIELLKTESADEKKIGRIQKDLGLEILPYIEKNKQDATLEQISDILQQHSIAQSIKIEIGSNLLSAFPLLDRSLRNKISVILENWQKNYPEEIPPKIDEFIKLNQNSRSEVRSKMYQKSNEQQKKMFTALENGEDDIAFEALGIDTEDSFQKQIIYDIWNAVHPLENINLQVEVLRYSIDHDTNDDDYDKICSIIEESKAETKETEELKLKITERLISLLKSKPDLDLNLLESVSTFIENLERDDRISLVDTQLVQGILDEKAQSREKIALTRLLGRVVDWLEDDQRKRIFEFLEGEIQPSNDIELRSAAIRSLSELAGAMKNDYKKKTFEILKPIMDNDKEVFEVRNATVSGLTYLYSEYKFDEKIKRELIDSFEKLYKQAGTPGWRNIDRLLTALRNTEELKKIKKAV